MCTKYTNFPDEGFRYDARSDIAIGILCTNIDLSHGLNKYWKYKVYES